MASGMRGAGKHGMDPDEVEEFMQECSRLLEAGQTVISTPNPWPSMSRPDEDDTLQKGTSEMDELRHLLHMQRLEMTELRQELAQRQSKAPGLDNVFLGTLTMEYNGESDLEDYLYLV